MAGFQLTEVINKSPLEVFNYLVDAEKVMSLRPTMRKVERNEDGPLAKGSQYRQVKGHGGHDHESLVEITAFERPALYQVSVEKEQIRATYTYNLSASETGTNVSLAADVRGDGIRRLLAWIVAQTMKKKDGDILEKLKIAVEADHVAAIA